MGSRVRSSPSRQKRHLRVAFFDLNLYRFPFCTNFEKTVNMNPQINISTIEFLSELKENNDREWFQDNKLRYNAAAENFKQFIVALIAGINDFDKSVGLIEPSDCLFRIYRDVRFSPNKEPYKTNFGAYIAAGGRKSPFAGYYFHIEPNASFISGGIYMAPSDTMKKIREEISDGEDEFLKIVESKAFKNNFVFDESERLKKLPRGYEAGSKVDEFLKLKHITPYHELSNNKLLQPNIMELSLTVYREMFPLVEFLNRAIK